MTRYYFLSAVVLLAFINKALGAVTALKAYDQCGGLSNCSQGPNCKGVWAFAVCPARYSCVKSNDYYYQCVPASGGNNTPPPQNTPPPVKPPPKPTNIAGIPLNAAGNVPLKLTASGDYDYSTVIKLSNLFYFAQRSGRLPADNPIKWRGNAGLNHKAPDGRDVTGGWYDAGDNVKFNLPMAWTAAVLSWSVFDFREGYRKAGTLPETLANIRWANDYFIKCVGDGNTIVAQVGNGGQDHSGWTRPEDVTGAVPVYVVTPSKPGSDVVGAMAASLAAASVIFTSTDYAYSVKLLAAALKAYKFATTYLGSYSASIPDAAQFYKSSNYYDDLAWAAIWLNVRTGKPEYKTAAVEFYKKHWNMENGAQVWNNFDWDSNSWADVMILHRMFPNDAFYKKRMLTFIDDWLTGRGPPNYVTYTPKGLAFSGDWGSLRHVGNALFLMQSFVHTSKDQALNRRINCFTHRQLRYILGSTGRSFVVGFGNNPPQQPHHRAASCTPGQPCSWDALNNPGPNPNVLYGALVGGPNVQDVYSDNRNNFVQNEVACDYNAGFQGALAAMVTSNVNWPSCSAQYTQYQEMGF
eukprot:jgi/Chrzof1/14173/Cz08g28050.t1